MCVANAQTVPNKGVLNTSIKIQTTKFFSLAKSQSCLVKIPPSGVGFWFFLFYIQINHSAN
jgi:hypothetical protein